MLDIKLLRENPEKVKEGVAAKQLDPKIVDQVLLADRKKREILEETENLRAERNKLAKLGKETAEAKELKKRLKLVEQELKKSEKEFQYFMLQLPNLPAEDVPIGKDASGNVVVRRWGKPTQFNFKPRDHMELGEILDIIDTDLAAKVTGTRFGYLKGGAALLEFAIIQHTFSILTNEKILKAIAEKIEKGYSSKPFIPVVPPVMIRPEVFTRMARLDPGQEEERYFLPKDNLYLIGSAEHTLGPMHIDEMIPEDKLPIRYVGFSTSFRREAGSYGQDTKGILRVHQFDKIEMESFTTPEDSVKEQEFIVRIQEYLMQSLETPYQVVMICTGDMGGPNYRQIDIEVWLPGQNQYRETHTSDLMTDYQSRRLNTKVKRKNGKVELVHMNDATALAIGRTIIAILENYQQKDGSVLVPKVLQKYTGFAKISPKK